MGRLQNQKTIFITSFFGLIARNILSTETLSILRRRSDLRIVILTPEDKRSSHQQFAGGNVVVEGVHIAQPTRLDRAFTVLFHSLSDTVAWRIHRLISRKRDGAYVSAPFHWLISQLGHFKILRLWARWLEFRLLSKNRYAKYFEKYCPSLVFVTDIFNDPDIDVMREAKARRIFTLGMVRSWDNITSKGLNHLIPDKLVVNTEKIKDEAVRYNDVRSDDVVVVGVPHYDRYVQDRRISKTELLKSLNLDPKKKTIFFAPPSDIYSEHNPVSVQIIKALSDHFPDCQFLLRLYIVGKADLGDIKAIPNRIAIDDPGSREDFVDVDLTAGDSHLADLLYHSDVVVAFASTLAIDAVVFNKPVVFIGFDGDQRPYWQSLRRFYDYDHQRDVLKTGGIKLAKNMEELLQYVQNYLADPSLDGAGRKKIIEERCWKLDGKSGKRLADIINDIVSR